MIARVLLSNFYDDGIINTYRKGFLRRTHLQLEVHLVKTEVCQYIYVAAKQGLLKRDKICSCLRQALGSSCSAFAVLRDFSVVFMDQLFC